MQQKCFDDHDSALGHFSTSSTGKQTLVICSGLWQDAKQKRNHTQIH